MSLLQKFLSTPTWGEMKRMEIAQRRRANELMEREVKAVELASAYKVSTDKMGRMIEALDQIANDVWLDGDIGKIQEIARRALRDP